MEQGFERFKDAPWFNEGEESVVVGGAGGIGSWLSFLLARAGFKVSLVDFDIIEPHNIGGQLFKASHVGRVKISAVSEIVREFSGSDINTFNERVTPETIPHHFMFGAFDNMEARKSLFESWKKIAADSPVMPILIDGRLEAEHLQIFCVTPSTMDKYESEQLFDDSSVPDLPCTLKQTSHTAAIIAGTMVGFFTNHLTNIYAREVIREVPYFYEFVIPANITVTND